VTTVEVVALVDVVVVSYNSRSLLRACVEPLASEEDVRVIVVDNNSRDGSLDVVTDLSVERVQLSENRGFAYGSNVGWRTGTGEFVLLLNPDARLAPADLGRMVAAFTERPAAGAVAPKIVDGDGSLDYSLRRFPRIRSRFAQAFFLHRLAPRAEWADEVLRDTRIYDGPRAAEWVSGACILLRRSALERLNGMDDRFFLYCEDIDLCRRLWDEGYEVWYEPGATCIHEGGQSAPRSSLTPVLAASRLRYAAKHFGPLRRMAERLGILAGCATHVLISKGGRPVRVGYARAFVVALSPTRVMHVQSSG
jgi:N-acetylglucosaminyl-diphospho-decaprenol L-rhamnosyltransferase